jgi:hypothetical protein
MGPTKCAPDSPTSECVLTGAAGIFVAPAANGGADDNDGTPNSPVLTVAHALELAVSAQVPVYICAGVYKEHVQITDNGVSLRGGYTCDDSVWTYQHAKRSRIAPTTPGEALRIKSIDSLEVMDLDLTAPSAVDPGESSVGVFVTNSKNVVFNRARITAGSGANGAAGTLEPYTYASADELKGNDASGSMAGLEKTDCPVCEGTSIITSGGQGGIATQNGTAGEPQNLGGGAGGTVEATECTNGSRGADAPAADTGAGAGDAGSLSTTGWAPTPGSSGGNGTPGQGGGGGGGAVDTGKGAGGGGACGGCGGKGASPGSGGGASIALLSFGSKVSLKSSTLETSNAGKGGAGAAGQAAQTGGVGGNRSGMACLGGNGGTGGTGGASGGGAGGISVGIVYDDAASVITVDSQTTITPGTPGVGGTGGAGVSNKGVDGVAVGQLHV